MNERIWVYLLAQYSLTAATAGNTAMVQRYLAAASGDMNARFRALLAAA